jgi:hypothetical protein
MIQVSSHPKQASETMKSKNQKAKAVRMVKKAHAEMWARIGGLSAPSKMPGFSIGIPARFCKVGSKLAKVKGSVCFKCYALKGNYRYDNVVKAQNARFAALDSPTWTADMTQVIKSACEALGENFFRWHDSGDVQSVRHLMNIIQVCKNLPHISFWLPTKEYALIKMLAHINVPANLTVRVSAPKVDLSYKVGPGLTSSSVSTHKTWVKRAPIATPGSKMCAAPSQEGECGDCRDCWSQSVPNVCYPVH